MSLGKAFAAEMAVVGREAMEVVARLMWIAWASRQSEQRSAEWDPGTKLAGMALTACERWLARAELCGSLTRRIVAGIWLIGRLGAG